MICSYVLILKTSQVIKVRTGRQRTLAEGRRRPKSVRGGDEEPGG